MWSAQKNLTVHTSKYVVVKWPSVRNHRRKKTTQCVTRKQWSVLTEHARAQFAFIIMAPWNHASVRLTKKMVRFCDRVFLTKLSFIASVEELKKNCHVCCRHKETGVCKSTGELTSYFGRISLGSIFTLFIHFL